MRYRFTAISLGLIMACARQPGMPVPVHGIAAVLEGEWAGEYSSGESRRSGSLAFTLAAEHDTAFGYIVMTPALAETAPAEARPERLAIRFVQVSRDRVLGELEPYRDPGCGCELTTTFIGHLVADRIEGTYLSYHSPEQHTVSGRWSAVRSRGPATPPRPPGQ